ncbi:OLC1v1000371C1 [Oldenlandia corymbosa var. corymbosa]|uniref:OLC1v1000371C1 n=1 Tax=Oldenlandia corymbosa var. corymbosa TaxID=529605 RepID=A0AAV1D2N9_OLDCO|nr:OLC1v1000371C1 [Oldenlandia corymbosa var. corymbosa]
MKNSTENLSESSGAVAPVDRISNLPDSILFHIFSFLTTDSVVATSALSKRWKRRQMNFVEFVNKVLIELDSRRLEVFRLQGAGLGVTKWIEAWSDGTLEIDAPALESLELSHLKLKEISVKKPTCLNVAKLGFHGYPNGEELFTKWCNWMVKLVEVVNHINPSGNQRCGYFHWTSVSVMLDSSINLKVLKFEKLQWGGTVPQEGWVNPKNIPKCLSSSLEELSFVGFSGHHEDEMTVIRYVLEHGDVMRRIELESADKCIESCHECPEQKIILLGKILMFPRSSRTCAVQFDSVQFHASPYNS